MPFQLSRTDPAPPGPIQLRVVTPRTFQLVDGFAYRPAGEDHGIDVPAHNPSNPDDTTDLASVPGFLWGLLGSYGRQLRAALLHDRLCDSAKKLKMTDPAKAYADRRRADDLFRIAMRDEGDGSLEDREQRVGWARSWLFWTGVSVGRYASYRLVRATLLILQIVCAVYCVYRYVRVPQLDWLIDKLARLPLLDRVDAPTWVTDSSRHLAYYLVLVALSIAWGRDFRIAAIGCIVAPIVLPVIVVTLAAQFVLNLPDIVLGFLPGEPGGTLKPTFRRVI